jgi:hypothetical protein
MTNQLSPYFQKQEARNNKMLAVMLSIVEDFPDYQFVMRALKSGVFLL